MEKSGVKEMSMKNFKKLVKILRQNKVKTLRLMGGEPTFHSQFKQIVKIGKENFQEIIIFTNGLIPEKNKKFLEKDLFKISFNFNLDTPAFEGSIKKRKQIIKLIKDFSQKTKVNIGFTLSDLKKDYRSLFKDFGQKALSRMGVRFGFAKAVVGKQPFFTREDWPKLGKKTIHLVKFFEGKRMKKIFLDCGLQKEMFTSSEMDYLSRNVHIKGWGCQGKWSSFDIAPDLIIFPCFPYYQEIRRKLGGFACFLEASEYFSQQNKSCFK